ncbi:BREX-2 system adenine-specific DNA-methyltransferase PglX [uncultured Thiodictyon sp.]|uniref:BREX-2 system adenine-specific DNA-methyltransferase PglX n=1 Tax=uncultured Thiodictyon sp. TaxID=1846217 RepID=UPI0025D8EED5|nr:BREX-2 system adenine-specific DNA-methyltransferase PglX [uncultured Thiodictyon sp.]
MIQAPALLKDLQRLLKVLEDDLRVRIGEDGALGATLEGEWQAARAAGRTGETYAAWLEADITQAAVHWLLSCVFVRFIEDNGLIPRPWLAGPTGCENNRLALARDRHEGWFRARPHDNDRDYLLACFREVGQLPGLEDLFDERHNPVFRLGCSGDAAMALMAFWQKIDPDRGLLVHDFTDPGRNTRFLGDLYQDLSEATRKRYALLQTPEFVEEFILDRTLTPALDTFGYQAVRLIDPTCGSGHFLLGAFARLLTIWARNEPARNPRDTVQRALDGVYGVDLNPFAVAIARFRLLVAALAACDIHALGDAPNFQLHLAVGDSLLHGPRFGLTGTMDLFDGDSYKGTSLEHAYAIEDLGQVNAILGQRYHAVVGNPPYITVKDSALNAAYRARYSSCHMKYSLGVPFTERFFDLALAENDNQSAGFVGLITSNAFMKREFGAKLIEEVLPGFDLTHILDTSRAHIPGHGTPTVILFGRCRAPIESTVRAVMSIKGEHIRPDVPADGPVWRAIITQIDLAGSEGEFVTVADVDRSILYVHPWSISGGGAAELKQVITSNRDTLSEIADVGIGAVTLEDEAFQISRDIAIRQRFPQRFIRNFVTGDSVRDWSLDENSIALVPHTGETFKPELAEDVLPWLWPLRANLSRRLWFKKTQVQRGHAWYAYGHISIDKFRSPFALTLAFLATHTGGAFIRDGWICNRTAPMIKLRADVTEERYLRLLGIINSSVACFWLKHTLMDRGGGGIGGGLATETWEKFYEHDSGKLQGLPLPEIQPLEVPSRLDTLAHQLAEALPPRLLVTANASGNAIPTRATLDSASANAIRLRHLMIAAQEELDWNCYQIYGLMPAGTDPSDVAYRPLIEVALGERAFEIVLARLMAAGIEETTWFERHGSIPITEIPSHWPEEYRCVVQRRIELIENDRNIGLIERPEYKRRWNSQSWAEQEKTALKGWLLDRLETPSYWPDPVALTSTNRLADRAQRDADFMQVAELYAGRQDFDPAALVAALVAAESVPFLPVLRYSESGLRKREQWESTWDLQRREDLGEQVGEIPGGIPVPPKYKSTDFLKTDCWRLRGGLDVSKERWVSYPGAERGADGSLVIAWAGWNHLQQATALAAYYLDMKEGEGWEPARLQPLLAGLLELIPWLKQWHNDYDAEHATRMGDYFAGFLADEARTLGLTLDDLRAWKPAAVAVRRGRRKAG